MRSLLFFFFCICTLFPAVAQELFRPLIGISCSYPDSMFMSVRKTYTESVIKAGGIPILIPVTESEDVLRKIVCRLDALILSGGEDICPSYYNEEPIEELGNVNGVRDVYDLLLVKLAEEYALPTLGICRGLQVINVAYGGSLYQDIPAQYPDTTVRHQQKEKSNIATHLVKLIPGSKIAAMMEHPELMTNTHHHQAIKDVAPGFWVTAHTLDGIPEAIEAIDGRPIYGVQFHPEGQAIEDDEVMLSLFRFLVKQTLSR